MKKIIAFLICVSFALSVTAYAQSEPSDWAKSEVDTSAAAFLKAADGEINYTAGITRRQFAVVALYLYGNMSGVEIPQLSVENPFDDCDDPLVVAAYGLGLVQGMSESEFCPDEPVTREQICVMISRMAGDKKPALLPELDGFKDAESVSDWAKEAVALCVAAEIVKGTDEGNIDPKGNCTVEQALIIAKRIRNM